MPRTRKTYAETHAETIRNGASPELAIVESKAEAEVNELDKPEVQAAILRPEKVTIQLRDGEIELPTQLTLGSTFEARTMAVINALTMVVVKSVKELSGDLVQDEKWFERNFEYIPMVVYKEPVINVVSDFIGMLAKKPAQDFRGSITAETVSQVFMLALRIVADLKKPSGETQAKNVA